MLSQDKNPVFETLFDANAAVTPIPISRVSDDGTIIKETISSTNGYTKNFLHVDAFVLALMRAIGQWGDKYCAVEFEIDHLYILPVSAPPIYAAASTSSMSTPTSTPTKQLNTRLTEINFN